MIIINFRLVKRGGDVLSFVEEEVTIPIDADKAQQLCIINKQIFASTAIIFAILITILVLKGFKKVLFIEDLEEIERITTINDRLVKFSILIVLIVSFYYLYQSLENYQTSCDYVEKNYVVANTLSVLAAIIKFWTIYSSSNNTLNEEETETEII